MRPRFSVIIPFYNAEKTLLRSISSVMGQEFRDWELILVDDGSADGSLNLAQGFVSERICVFSQPNGGVSAARNTGTAKSSGRWLVFLDADDCLRPEALKEMARAVSANPGHDCFHFGVSRVHSNGVEERLPGVNGYTPTLAGSFLMKKELFERVGGYDERLRFSENTELFHRIKREGIPVLSLPWVSMDYHDSRDGGSKNLQNMVDSLTIILEKHKDTLSVHLKHLYHQIIGVNSIRFRRFSDARCHLWKAISYKPLTIATWGRFGLACFPFLAKRLYSETVNHA